MSEEIEELSNSQKSIWLTEQYYQDSNINNICGTAIIKEKVDFEKLQKSIELVCQKNDNFKLKFFIDNGIVKQTLSNQLNKIDIINVANKKELEQIREEIVQQKFKVDNSLLYKFYIFKFSNGEGAFTLNIHHLISDAWTLAFICNEIIKTYSQLKKNEEIKEEKNYSYLDYLKTEKEYLKSEKFLKDKEYWLEKYNKIPEVAEILGSSTKKQGLIDSSAKRINIKLEKQNIEEIKSYCKTNKISLYNFFMAIYSIYIAEITGLNEFAIGTPILNRTNYKDKNTAGMFINVAPFKINYGENIKFEEYLKEISIDSLNMLKHQKYSYQCLLEELRLREKNIPNLYNILLSYQITNAQMSGEDVKYNTEWTFNGNCAEDIEIQIYDLNDTGSLNISYDYKTSKYTEKDIRDIHKRIINIIKQVIQNNDILIKDIEIITDEEKNKIEGFNKTELKYDKTETVVDMFEKQVKQNPNKIAIICNDKKITYEQLNEGANILAYEMQKNGVKQEDIIGLMQYRSIEMIISILAILKCGATYLPIDPEYPEDRISYMLENSESKTVLVDNQTEKLIKEKVTTINVEKVDFSNKNTNIPKIKIPANSVAYMIYTSGSTGKPKGVQVTNQNLSNFIKGVKEKIDFSSDKVMVSVTTICFDIFGLEIWGSLTSGITLVVANEEEQNTPALLNKLCVKNNVNIIQTTPSRYSVIFEEKQNIQFTKKLTDILVGGEAINKKLLLEMQKKTNVKIFNMYGPTETTIWSTIKELTNEKEITVGKPIANTQCYILNKNGKMLPIGTPGELYIGGDGVSRGYFKREELNKEKFVNSKYSHKGKIYNTNDLAYYKENGEIVHLGRTDFQIKIRGFRVELGEIENAIEKNPKVKQAVVVMKKLNNGHDALIGYYTTSENNENIEKRIREELLKQLPKYMVPQYLMKIDNMPYTPNGKVDRKALPNPEFKENNKKAIKPRNEIDKELIKIIEKMLQISNVGINSTLLELGGDSLTAITLSTKILSKFNVQINIKDLLSNYTIKNMSDYIKQNGTNHTLKIKIEKAPIQENYPLSSAQKRIYYNVKMIGDNNIVYNMPWAMIIDEILNKEKVQNVFEKIINRHSTLRTSFIVEKESVVQKVEDNVKFNIDTYQNSESEIQDIVNNFSKPFKLEKAPLFRVEMHYIDNKKTLLLLDTHHIIMDGTALNNLVIEFNRLYNGEDLKNIPIQYKDYAVWENEYNNSSLIKVQENYWVNKFKDCSFSQLNLPYDYKVPTLRSYNGNKIINVIDERFFRKIERYAKKLGVSPYMFFVSILFVVLYKYIGQDDINIGSPIANRDRNETKRMFGMFVNNIVLRGKIDSDKTFEEFLIEIKEQLLEDLTYQPYPFDMLIKKLKIDTDASRNPLFDVMFTYQNKQETFLKINNKEAQVVSINNRISKFNLSLEVQPKTHSINIEYCTDLFEKETIEKLFINYMNTINYIMCNTNSKIKEIQLLSSREKNKILYGFNNTYKEYPEKTFSTLFEEQVNKTPDKIALVFEDKKLTYKELNEKANSLAYYLRNVKQVKREDAIGVMVNRSLEMIISILGIMKAGGTYIPIDPNYPQERIEYMLEEASASVLLTCKKIAKKMNYRNQTIVDLDNIEIYGLPNENIKNINSLNDLLYIIFTSGSTGKPKGVMQKHKTLVNFAHYCNDYVGYLKNPQDQAIVSISTVSFDIFSYEALIPLQRGVKVVIANEDEQTTPQLLNDVIIKNNVTATQATPSVMQIFVNDIENIPSLKDLKYLTLTGEQVPVALVKKLKSLTNITIYDGYGPTETYYCTLTEVKDDFITIGKPFYNDQMYILDKDLQPVPVGVVGEIYISGDGLARGYLNNPELTAKSFVKNPFIKNTLMYKSGDLGKYLDDGNIICLGRSDNQIKIRGLRIELRRN